MTKTENPPKVKTETKIEVNTTPRLSSKSLKEGAQIEGSFSQNFAKIQGNFTHKTSTKPSSDPKKDPSSSRMGARKMGTAKLEPSKTIVQEKAASKQQEPSKIELQVEMSSGKKSSSAKASHAAPSGKKGSHDSHSGGGSGKSGKKPVPMHNVYTFKIRVPKTNDGKISLVENGVAKPMITIVGPIETPVSESMAEDARMEHQVSIIRIYYL